MPATRDERRPKACGGPRPIPRKQHPRCSRSRWLLPGLALLRRPPPAVENRRLRARMTRTVESDCSRNCTRDPVSNVKTARSWLIVLGAAVALAALTLTLALLPAVQRRVLLWIAAGRPGLTLDVDRVAIRPGTAEIRGLRLQTAGAQVSVAEASFDIAWWQAVV